MHFRRLYFGRVKSVDIEPPFFIFILWMYLVKVILRPFPACVFPSPLWQRGHRVLWRHRE